MKIKDLLVKVLTKKEMEKLVTSFDIVGDIAIIEIPRGLGKKKKVIANAIMAIHKNVRVVAKKSLVEGKYRVRKLKIIATRTGNRRLETVHREHGCAMRLDPSKVYFSVRLSHERERIASLVKDRENVLVMFAGVGPFALVIAKKRPLAKVVGIELNRVAAKYFAENITLNGLKNCEVIHGDVKKIIPKRFACWADRILMPLPKSAKGFLNIAFTAARENATIHFYHFGPEKSVFESAEGAIRMAAARVNAKTEILNKKIVRPYAPGIVQAVIDFKVRRNAS